MRPSCKLFRKCSVLYWTECSVLLWTVLRVFVWRQCGYAADKCKLARTVCVSRSGVTRSHIGCDARVRSFDFHSLHTLTPMGLVVRQNVPRGQSLTAGHSRVPALTTWPARTVPFPARRRLLSPVRAQPDDHNVGKRRADPARTNMTDVQTEDEGPQSGGHALSAR